jgi:hypothetical protein
MRLASAHAFVRWPLAVLNGSYHGHPPFTALGLCSGSPSWEHIAGQGGQHAAAAARPRDPGPGTRGRAVRQGRVVQPERLGLEAVGVFHSHPDHPATASDFDREWALPWYSYLITRILQGRAAESRSWRLTDDRLQMLEEALDADQIAAARGCCIYGQYKVERVIATFLNLEYCSLQNQLPNVEDVGSQYYEYRSTYGRCRMPVDESPVDWDE